LHALFNAAFNKFGMTNYYAQSLIFTIPSLVFGKRLHDKQQANKCKAITKIREIAGTKIIRYQNTQYC